MSESTHQIDTWQEEVEDGEEMLRPGVVDITTHHGGRNGSKSFDNGGCAMRLQNVSTVEWHKYVALTSTRASKAGSARSRIGWRMRSGSMTLIDFKQL